MLGKNHIDRGKIFLLLWMSRLQDDFRVCSRKPFLFNHIKLNDEVKYKDHLIVLSLRRRFVYLINYFSLPLNVDTFVCSFSRHQRYLTTRTLFKLFHGKLYNKFKI